MTTMAVKRKSILNNRRGMATIEVVPLIVIFLMMLGYSLGLWGSVHTAILHSISARAYAFETFRNRTDLRIFRENAHADKSNLLSYANFGIRLHSITSENSPQDSQFYASQRPLTIGYPGPGKMGSRQDHAEKIFQILPRNQTVSISPIWLMISYGMCLDSTCGQD
jgi:hypothetical protein